jgi:hypothetical protein
MAKKEVRKGRSGGFKRNKIYNSQGGKWSLPACSLYKFEVVLFKFPCYIYTRKPCYVEENVYSKYIEKYLHVYLTKERGHQWRYRTTSILQFSSEMQKTWHTCYSRPQE